MKKVASQDARRTELSTDGPAPISAMSGRQFHDALPDDRPDQLPSTSPGNREDVAALAERGRRTAAHFPNVNQAGPTRSATASTNAA